MRSKMTLIRVGLLPSDLLLRVMGPKYLLFFWFFKLAPPSFVA